MTAQPDLIAAAATDVAEIRSAIGAANATAAARTTGVVAAAADEVSAACASLFNAYAREYEAVIGQVSSFHDEFIQALGAAGSAYTQAEAASAATMSGALGSVTAPFRSLLGGGGAAPAAAITTLVMGASGYPIPSQLYIDTLSGLFVTPPLGTLVGLPTPEGLYPLSGIMDLTFDVSAARGLTILNNAIQSAFAGGSTTVNVFGYSQTSVIASLEMRALNPTNTPGGSPLDLHFSLVGNPSNPNGGLLTRFPGLSLPSLGLNLFGTATPDNSFPTKIYTIEYDGFADFPQYPINVLSDLNAFLGIAELHGNYPFLAPDQVASAVQLTNTVGTPLTYYYIVRSDHLPLVSPLRAIPVIGTPLADLVEPDLRVLVNLGYGSTTQGWSPDPPNVPTGFGVIPPVSLGEVASALATGTQQGIGAFTNDINAMLASPPNLSGLTSAVGSVGTTASSLLPPLTSAVSSPHNFIAALQSANTFVSNAISGSASAAYATLLPTADIANALATSVPSYDLNLFLDGVERIANGDPTGGLIYAVGAPLAANTALLTLFAGFEVRVFQHAATTIYYDVTGTSPPPP